MRLETEIKKWGNSLALRVTGPMADIPEFKQGTRVMVLVTTDGFEVKRAMGVSGRYRFPRSESELLEGMNPETAHADSLAVLANNELEELDGYTARVQANAGKSVATAGRD